MTGTQQPIGNYPAENPTCSSAQRGQCRRKAHLHDRQMPCLRQINGKPGEKKPSQRGDAVLAEVDTDQHAMTQQLLDRSPGKQTSLPRAGTDQTTALLDGVNLGGRDAGMVSDIVDILDPDQSKDEAEYAHEPKAAPPACRVNNPAQNGGEDHQRKILRRVENRGSPA